LFVRPMRRLHQVSRRIEFRHQSVDGNLLHSALTSFASGSSVRISKIEIIGKMRMNRKNAAMKKPSVPMYVIQSHLVGEYMPQEEVWKSRCKLTTTMMNRSSRIPTSTTNETRNNNHGLLRH